MPEEVKLLLVANGSLVLGAAVKLVVAWLQHHTRRFEQEEE